MEILEIADKTIDTMEMVLFTTISSQDIGKMRVSDYHTIAVISAPYAKANPNMSSKDKARIRAYLDKAVMLN